MRSGLAFALASFALGCADIKQASPPADAGETPPVATDQEADGGLPSDPGAGSPARVEDLIGGRSRLGARSSAGFRPWRSGLAVHGDRLYWVESGTSPGLYSAPTTCTSESCVTTIATLTRPSAFTATATALYTSDTTVIQRLDFAGGAKLTQVATAPDDVVNLASDGQNVFWTSGTKSEIWRTTPAKTTSAIIHSNGTPVAMGIAGERVYWAGVDISGQLGALQSIRTAGTGAREESRFSSGFEVIGGNGTYLYYAKDDPATVHRVTLSTGRDEVVASDCLGVADFAVDDTYAYWVEPGDGVDLSNGQVRRVAHDSKQAETLTVSVPYPVAIAAAGTTVFVASAGTGDKSFSDGKILKLTLSK